jgi:hypothetical protein
LSVGLVPIVLGGIVAVSVATRQPDRPAPAASGASVAATSAEPSATASPDPRYALDPDVFPRTFNELPVRSVRATLAEYAASRADGLVAVGAYLTYVGPVGDCPGGSGFRNSLAFCRRETLLADRPESPYASSDQNRWTRLGPHLHPIAMPGTYVPVAVSAAVPLEQRTPTPVVLLGRFDDERAGLCPEGQPCEPMLSIEWVPWASGRMRPPNGATDPALREVGTNLDERDRRRSRLAALPDSGPMLELALSRAMLSRVDPIASLALGSVGPGIAPIWYLRLLSPEAEGRWDVDWLVLDDATGRVLASSSDSD